MSHAAISRRPIPVLLMAAALVLPLGGALAQDPPVADEAPGTETAPVAEAAGASPESVRYRRESIRDPFRSLLDQQKKAEGPRPAGPPGMLIEEIDLVGVLSGPRGNMVLIIGSDGLGYSLTEGAKLYDGRVLRISQADGTVVFRQDVSDPTRIKPYRDIERRLDSAS